MKINKKVRKQEVALKTVSNIHNKLLEKNINQFNKLKHTENKRIAPKIKPDSFSLKELEYEGCFSGDQDK